MRTRRQQTARTPRKVLGAGQIRIYPLGMSTRPGYSVLVIDDDADVRESMIDWLTSNGYEASSAANGREALKLLRGGERAPDAILLDMMMPIMDGLSFRWEQLADPTLSSIPVIILSAQGHCREAAVELEAAGCIKKPCQPDALIELLGRVCHPA
jgi:CheY-like chemotaxis protein